MKKLLIILLTFFSLSAYSQSGFDKVFRKATLDTIRNRVDSIYIKGPVSIENEVIFKDTARYKTPIYVNGNYFDGVINQSPWTDYGDSIEFNGKTKTDTLITERIGIGITKPLSALHISKGTGSLTDGISFGDGNTGLHESPDNSLRITNNGINYWIIDGNLRSTQGAGSILLDPLVATATIPRYTFNSDQNTGLGRNSDDQLSIIAGNKEIARASENVTEQFIINPQGDLTGIATAPNLAFGDGNTGFYESSDNILAFTSAGGVRFNLYTGGIFANSSNGFELRNESPTAINPIYTFISDLNTGIGRATDDQLSLIAGDIEGIRILKDSTYHDSIAVFNSGIKFSDGTIQTTAATSSIGGNNNDVLLSDGAGSTKTNADFNYLNGRLEMSSSSGERVSIGELAANDGISVTALGYYAGRNTTANNGTFIGGRAGTANTTGYSNTFIGSTSGANNNVGFNNTFIGSTSGNTNVSGDNNTAVGSIALFSSTGNNNTGIGYQVGRNNTGNYNVFVGANSGYNSGSGSSNIFIGDSAGYNETGSNKLYIENSNSSNPLIGGDFSTNTVTINDTLIVSGTIKGVVNVVKAQLLYTNTSQTTIITLPSNTIIKEIDLQIKTNFNGSGNDYLDIGITGDSDKYVLDYDISATEFTADISNNTPDEVIGSTNVTFQYKDENSDATQGEAYIYIYYIVF